MRVWSTREHLGVISIALDIRESNVVHTIDDGADTINDGFSRTLLCEPQELLPDI